MISLPVVDQAGVASVLPSFIPTVALIVLLALAWAVWASPKGCEWVAQILRARAAGLKAYREVYDRMRPKREGEEVQPLVKNWTLLSQEELLAATNDLSIGRTIGDDL